MNYITDGNGEALVFIHGLSDSLLYWEFLATNLKNDYQTIRFDLRGHGNSELGNDEITMELFVDDLTNLLDELNVDKVNLIGFSLGGAIALDFLFKYPERVSSIVLMSSFYKSDEHMTNVLSQFKNALKNSFEDFYDLILPMILCPDVIEENKEELEFFKEISSQTANPEAYIKAIDASLMFDVEDRLSEINIPTLIFAGRYDELIPLYINENMHKNIKNSEFVVLDNAKHNLLVGNNNMEVLSTLKNFYEKKKS